jgi:uncharacterized protein (TIGR03437 family)
MRIEYVTSLSFGGKMKTLRVMAGSLLFAGMAAAQAPSVATGGVLNNYSYMQQGLPSYGIAQGSIFSIFGSNLAASASNLQSVPLSTALNGVSVKVTVNGTTTNAILYYVSPGLIDAILPSATPVGTGTLTVTTGAGTSQPAPITVAQGAFGILTLNQAGTGAAWAFDANNGYATVGYASAANPGDVVVIYGSGLGPVTGDETKTQTQTDLSNQPIEVDIGGVAGTVAYHGRTVFPGLDQVNFTLPSGVATGCNVSLVVRTGNFVSNATTIAVAAAGSRTCSDPNTGYSSAVLSKCATSGCSTGSITVGKTTVISQGITVPGIGTIGGGTTVSDDVSADFTKFTALQAAGGIFGASITSVGSCNVYTFSSSGSSNPTPPTVTATQLNAGTITMSGAASGTLTYNKGFYDLYDSKGGLIPASGGQFSFNNGGGGPDIGSFTTSTTLGTSLTSNVSTANLTVTRASGQNVTWTGGMPGTYVVISGYSMAPVGSSTTNFVGAFFWCTAPQSAGSFLVPSSVLLTLPPTGSITQQGVSVALPTTLGISNSTNPVTFTATGLDQGVLVGSYSITNQVTYK